MSRYVVRITKPAKLDLDGLRAFDARRIVDEMRTLETDAGTENPPRIKKLEGFAPTWDHVPPVWRLRVGDYRVFYDIDGSDVLVRRIMFKGTKDSKELE